MNQFTFEDKLDAIRRELKYRQRVYPRWIAEKRMTQHFADRQMKLFEEIEADYVKAAETDRLF